MCRNCILCNVFIAHNSFTIWHRVYILRIWEILYIKIIKRSKMLFSVTRSTVIKYLVNIPLNLVSFLHIVRAYCSLLKFSEKKSRLFCKKCTTKSCELVYYSSYRNFIGFFTLLLSSRNRKLIYEYQAQRKSHFSV